MNASNMMLSYLLQPQALTRGVSPVAIAAPSASEAKVEAFSSRGLITAMLAAVTAALVVAADQFIDRWSDGDLMLAGALLWVLVVAAIALLSGPLARLSNGFVQAWKAARIRRANEAELARRWQCAKGDPRLIEDMFGEDAYFVG